MHSGARGASASLTGQFDWDLEGYPSGTGRRSIGGFVMHTVGMEDEVVGKLNESYEYIPNAWGSSVFMSLLVSFDG